MSIKQIPSIFIALCALAGCQNASKLFPGCNVTKTGIHHRLIALGDGTTKAQPSNYITVQIAYRTTSDSLFFNGTRQLQVNEPPYPGSIDECFMMLTRGDSSTFYITAKPFFEQTLETQMPKFLKADDYIRIDIRMLEILTEDEFAREKEAFLSWIEDFGEYEKVIIKQYIEGQKIDVTPTASGLYIIPQQTNQEPRISEGDTITVHFEGRFMNGKIFDSTRKRNEPFIFVYGEKWQVIPGIEEALASMGAGERSLLIIPSDMAFGQEGNSNGLIPAFTSVLFEVEVMEVRQGPNTTN